MDNQQGSINIKNYKNISERKKVLKDLVNLDLEELKTLENKF